MPEKTMFSPFSFLLAVGFLLAGATAFAQRTISFAPYASPSGAGVVAIAVAKGVPNDGAFAEIDKATNGALQRAVKAARFEGERGKSLKLPGIGSFDEILIIGAGPQAATSSKALEDIGGLVGQYGAESAAQRIELLWAGTETDAGAHLAFGAELGQYRFTRYKQRNAADPVKGQGELVIRTPAGAEARKAYDAEWKPVADAVRFARNLITEPANEIYPESFVEQARRAFKDIPNVRIEVLDVPAMQKLGMGGILSVGGGSVRPPRLLAVHYLGGKAGEAPLAFVGKGITFDSGGISLKEPENMWRMKYDMSGAAAVTATVLALAGRKAPVNAVSVAALAENMPSGSSSRPGDVVRTMSGKTFEIMSTDAEGRMVLSDAVWYAQRQYKPRLLIDVATLTGAIVTALGDDYAGLFSRDEGLADALRKAGDISGEQVWRMPLHPSYAKDLESPIADLRNGSSTRGAGAGTGAHFIGAWIDESLSWAHLDIAGMAWRDNEEPTVPKGAAAFGVRLLDRFVREEHEAD